MSSQRIKPKLPITPKSTKMKTVDANVLQNRPSYSNSHFNKQGNSSAQKRKPRLNIISSQTPPKRPSMPTPAPSNDTSTSVVISQPFPSNIDWGNEDDDDDVLLATMNLDAQDQESSFKENMIAQPIVPGPSTNHPPSLNARPTTAPNTANKILSNNVGTIISNKFPSNTNSVGATMSSKFLSSGNNLGATASNKTFSSSNFRSSNISHHQPPPATTNVVTNKNPDALMKEILQLRNELLASHGEAKNLRLELQKKEKYVFDTKLRLEEEKRVAILEADKRCSLLKKELDRKNTELQFQTRDMADSEERVKAMRSLKKLTPGLSPPGKQKQTLHSSRVLFKENVEELETPRRESLSPRKDEAKIETYPDLTVDTHEGKILYDMLHPLLFEPPELENEIFVDQLESTKTINVSTIKNVLSLTQTVAKSEFDQQKNKNINKNEASNKPSKIISFSQLPFIPLYTMKSLDSENAQDLIRKICLKCFKLLEKFLLVLRNAVKSDKSYEKRVCKLATTCFNVALKDDSLFNPKRWYPDEKGIEVRRAVGVLSALASTSVHAVNLILQTNFAEHECNLANLFRNSLSLAENKKLARDENYELVDILSLSNKRKRSLSNSPEKRKLPRLSHMEASTSRMDVDESPSAKKGSSSEVVPSYSSKDDRRKIAGLAEKSDILQVILEIVTEICSQYRTLSFNGVLASVVSLLKSLAEMDCCIPIERLNVINSIIKQIVFCCPGPAVVREVISLMVRLAKYLTCINSLCIDSPQNSFIDSRKYYTFTTETCVLQVLCTECEVIEKTPEFAEDFTKWALVLTLDTSYCPHWLAGDCRMVTCDCFPRFIQLFLNTLHYAVLTYGDEEHPVSELCKNRLASVMRRGIIVLNRITLQRDDFLSQVGSWDGLYEAIVHNFLQVSKKVSFETPIDDMLNDLRHLEQTENPESSVQSQLDGKVNDILTLSSETSIEVQPSGRSTPVNLQLAKTNAAKKQKKRFVRKS